MINNANVATSANARINGLDGRERAREQRSRGENERATTSITN